MSATGATVEPSRPELSLQQMLAVEDDPELLAFACDVTRVPLWPFIRQQFLRCIVSDLMYETPLMTLGKPVRRAPQLEAVARAGARNLLRARGLTGQVVLMASGAGLTPTDGLLFNRFADHFAFAAHERTVVLEDLFEWRVPGPRRNKRVLYHAPLLVQNALAGMLLVRERHRRWARDLVALMTGRAKRLLDWDLGEHRAVWLTSYLARTAAQLPVTYRAYSRLFRRLGARSVIKEEGCYGHSAMVNAVGNDLGLATCEYQHGLVSAGHDAYNFAPVLVASAEYRRTLPRYFLSYGPWWTEQINAPLIMVPIGNPYRSELLRTRMTRVEHRDLLILGDGIEAGLYLELARRLTGVGLRVVFRPHPLERTKIARQFPDGRDGDVDIDVGGDIYQAFRSASVVVSELSTGLFEAAGLADKVFVWDTVKARFGCPNSPFPRFKDADELLHLLKDPGANATAVSSDRLWAPEWKANYLRFLDERGCGHA